MKVKDMSVGMTIGMEATEVFSGNRDNRPRRPIQCFTCYKEGHRYVDYPYKDRTDLKFCAHCGVGDHSLEDFPTMLEISINKKMLMSCRV